MASVANQFKIGDIEYAVAASAYGECSTAANTAAKAVTICTDGDTTNTAFTLIKGVSVQVKFTVTNTAASPTLNVNGSGAKAIYYNGAAITAGYLKVNKVYQFVYNGTQWDLVGDIDTNTTYTLPTASSSTLGGVKIGSNLSISNGVLSVPTASGTQAGATIVYPAASCTTFSSDSGTVTPLAVQKGAKMFSITRPSGTGAGPIARFTNTTGDVEYSKIKIENVTNTKDTSKTAQVISIPAEGGKKMVYGYCTDQTDGTSFIGGIFDSDATEFPYDQGLAIGGTSGNLLYKGKKVITADDLSTYANQKAFSNVTVGSTTIAADTPTDTLTLVAGSNVTITPDATNDKITIAATNSDTKNTAGTTNTTSKIYLAGATSQAANPQTYSNVNCYASGGYLYSGGQKQYTTTASATLSASSWSSGAYTYSNTAITADSIIEIIPATSITAAQLEAFQLANVVGTAQAAGSVTMKAFGTIPTVNIPVVFIIRG